MTQTTEQHADRTGAPTAAPAAGATAGTPGKKRDAFFDNAKYLAIVLVAVGHAWEPLRDSSRAVSALYVVVYTFHMPAVHHHLRLLLPQFRLPPRPGAAS